MSDPFFFIAMADPQLGRMPDESTVGFDTSLWEQAIDYTVRLRPAFVTALGDLIQTPTNDTQAQKVLQIGRKLPSKVPLHLVSGNHDLFAEPTRESLDWYRRTFGKDWYSFEYANCRFIVLNTTIINQPKAVQADVDIQFAWLRETLRSNDDENVTHTIILQHHPWFRDEPDEDHNSYSLPRLARRKHLDLFTKHGVSAIFAGHYHANHVVHFGDIEMVAAGTLSDRRSAAEPGFEVVKVYGDHIEHEYHTLRTMPDRVDL